MPLIPTSTACNLAININMFTYTKKKKKNSKRYLHTIKIKLAPKSKIVLNDSIYE